MALKLSEIRMLPREVPRDPFHRSILTKMVDGSLSDAEAATFFELPGVGFHRAQYLLTLHLKEYTKTGKQTFVIPSEMQKALQNTSMAGVQPSEVKVPHAEQYIALPDCEAELWGGPNTQWHKVGGVFMRYEQGKDRVLSDGEVREATEGDLGCIYLYLWGMENERSTGPGDDASLWMAVDLHEMMEQEDDLESYLWGILQDPNRDATLSDMVDPETMKDLGLVTTMPNDSEWGPRAQRGVVNALRIVFNTLLYLDSDGPDVMTDPETAQAEEERAEIKAALSRMKNPRKARGRKLQRRLDSLPTESVTWIGRGVSEKVESAEATSRATPRAHWVRGHWWPRRDTIRARIEPLIAARDDAYKVASQAKEKLAQSDVSDPSSLVVTAVDAHRHFLQCVDDLADLNSKLNAKRRWVRPYKKKGNGKAPEQHIYIVK